LNLWWSSMTYLNISVNRRTLGLGTGFIPALLRHKQDCSQGRGGGGGTIPFLCCEVLCGTLVKVGGVNCMQPLIQTYKLSNIFFVTVLFEKHNFSSKYYHHKNTHKENFKSIFVKSCTYSENIALYSMFNFWLSSLRWKHQPLLVSTFHEITPTHATILHLKGHSCHHVTPPRLVLLHPWTWEHQFGPTLTFLASVCIPYFYTKLIFIQSIYIETSVRNKCRCSLYCALLTLHVSAPIGGHLQVVL
jgi:hypothetical protein